MKSRSIFIILIVLLVAIVAGLVWFLDKGDTTVETKPEPEWITYRNEKYNIELKYPSDWTVFVEDKINSEPKINVYPKSVKLSPPFTHHSEVPNVSLFPKGIPTEGVIGTTASSTVVFAEPVVRAFDYILENGERWATFATLVVPPSSGWEKYGFVWARLPIGSHTQTCLGKDDEEFPVERCYELGDPGFTLIDNGSLEKEDRAIQEKILGSIRFIK